MSKDLILVVDDEADILELVRYNLEKEGYEAACAKSGEEAVAFVAKRRPGLVVLDLMLPGMDGFEVLRTIKSGSKTAGIPVMMLSAKGEDADIVAGLELGADDYMTKPFSPKVLAARIRTILRRKRKELPAGGKVISIHGIDIDEDRHRVSVRGKQVDLTATEFALLHFLAHQSGWVFTRNQLIDAVHGSNCAVTDRSVDVQIVGLRKKLGKEGSVIETVHGIGYRFRE